MEKAQVDEIARRLHEARLSAKPVPQFGDSLKEFTRADAYAVQEAGIAARLAAGERQVGLKMGLTSEAKRKQMGLESPLYGVLTDRMAVESGGSFSLKGSIHPKIEPEVAFLTARELKGEVSREQVLEACSAAAAALEILDSRYEQFAYFSMEEVISDNSSSSHFMVGPWRQDFRALELANLPMKMIVDGKVAAEGSSSAISGDPAVSVIELCRLLAERGKVLPAGSIVLTGAATVATQLEPGMRVEIDVEGFEPGSVSIVP